jgi:hypothetical protein
MTDDVRDIEAALGRAAATVPDDPRRLAGVLARRRRRSRLRIASALVLVLAGAGVGLVVVHSPGHRPARVTASGNGRPLVGASGEVIAVPGRPVRFCAPTPVADDLGSGPQIDRTCTGVDVVGVDLGTLADRSELDGVVNGRAALEGTYADGTLVVTKQGPPVTPAAASAGSDHIGCPAPAGGWARADPDGNATANITIAQAYQAAHPSQIVMLAEVRPTPASAVILLLTEGDPAPVRAALSGTYGPSQLCVARSAYSNAEVAAAVADPALQVPGPDGNTYSAGVGLDDATAQVSVEIQCVVQTPSITAAVARHPAGLVQVDPWLTPLAKP